MHSPRFFDVAAAGNRARLRPRFSLSHGQLIVCRLTDIVMCAATPNFPSLGSIQTDVPLYSRSATLNRASLPARHRTVGFSGKRDGASKKAGGDSVNSARLAALLDELVAVDLDLEPICRVGPEALPVIGAADIIAEACNVLRSAIADLRNIIYQVDGLNYLPSGGVSRPARTKHNVPRR